MAFPVILIPALTGLNRDTNPEEIIRIKASEASWLGNAYQLITLSSDKIGLQSNSPFIFLLNFSGSIIYVMTVVGSILSGIITEPMGRKRAMLFVNIPHLLGWVLLYFSTTHAQVFIGMCLLGLGVGLMEAPIITYVGEVRLVL